MAADVSETRLNLIDSLSPARAFLPRRLARIGPGRFGFTTACFSSGRASTLSWMLQPPAAVLNADGASPFDGVAITEPAFANPALRTFPSDFPEITWQVEPADPLADGRQTLLLSVSGDAESEGCAIGLKGTHCDSLGQRTHSWIR